MAPLGFCLSRWRMSAAAFPIRCQQPTQHLVVNRNRGGFAEGAPGIAGA